jgi:hypothetical protein
MSRCHDVSLVVVAVLSAAALVACSDRPPAAPSTPTGVLSGATPESIDAPSAPTVEGTYILSLATTTGQVVSTLPVSGFGLSSELLLWAQVRDSSGGLASGGTVIFQVCKLKGSYAPSAECDSGAGTWSHFATVRVAAGSCLPFAPETGNVCITFGGSSAPRTIGFRYRYIGQGTGIASDESESKDMTWVAVP